MGDRLSRVPLGTGRPSRPVRAGLAVLRASLLVSPRPMVWVIRRQLARTGGQLARSFGAQAPVDIAGVIDQHYDSGRHARLDLYTPGTAEEARTGLPTVVWTHGGSFVGGGKEDIGYYLRMIAAAGFTVVGLNYSLAPGARYPTPVREVMAALDYLQANADALRVDPSRFVLAGDCAGAQIMAQVAAILTNPDYQRQMGVESTISPNQVRGVALCCGLHDLTLIKPGSPIEDFSRAVGWAYSGTRHFLNNHDFISTMAVMTHVTRAFPPAFITAGNTDPLLPHAYALAGALRSKGVDIETLFYPVGHQPPLPHEYQFDLSLEDGRIALQRLIAFFERQTGVS